MNIIKLKDIIMCEQNSIAGIFNTFLKGRYAYWIQMRYIVPFEFMRHEGYVACEEDITKLLQRADGSYPKPYGCPYIDMYAENRCIMKYIDLEKTDSANNISEFKLFNNNVPDEDITVSMLKNFRTWLAQSLLDLNNLKDELDDDKSPETHIHILSYYANGMYNDVIKYLKMFNNSTIVSNTTTCGCCSSESLNSFAISECDSLVNYQKNIHNKMVEIFSDVYFWKQYPSDFLISFKKYIDNIIKVGLKINKTNIDYTNKYKDCTCNNSQESINTNILKRLSESLNYMIKDEEKLHKNFIYDSLYDWSSLLYEFMQW